MAKESSYFMYFPGNYRWSSAFINMMGSAAYGGSDIGELHKIGRLLKDKAPEDDTPVYFDVGPAEIFAAARERGATVL